MAGRTIRRLVFVFIILSDAQVGNAADEPSKPKYEVSFVSKMPSKPPANNFYVKLTLRNPTDKPRWFVLPYFGNDRLKSDTIRFYDRPADDPPFGSSRYKGKGGDAVIVGCFGSKSSAESFNAFLLPPRSEVVFEKYEIMTFGEVLEGIEVSEVSTILVNGKTPLEKWLPYSLASDDHACIPDDWDRELLDFDRKTYKKRTDYPTDPATSVEFKDVSRTFLKMHAFGMCKKRFPDQNWIVTDMRTLSLDQRFDGILAWNSFFHLCPDKQRKMFPIFRTHAGSKAALMFTSGPSHGEAIGNYKGEPLYHGSLDRAEYRSLLDQNGFDVVSHVVEDATCGHQTVWLAQLR